MGLLERGLFLKVYDGYKLQFLFPMLCLTVLYTLSADNPDSTTALASLCYKNLRVVAQGKWARNVNPQLTWIAIYMLLAATVLGIFLEKVSSWKTQPSTTVASRVLSL